MKVIVAGGGIGGLVTALALHDQGIDVTVHESVRQLEPLGVGINLLPHAMGVLAGLGLLERLSDLGVRTAELAYFNRHGQLIWREPRGLDAGYDVPQISVHRGRLQLELLGAVLERLGPQAVQTGHEVRGFDERAGGGVTVRLFDRATETEIVDHGDVLVAADGIHSRVRAVLYPNEGLPQWSGNVLWRSTSVAPAYLTGRSMVMVGHRPHKFVAYPIGPPDADGRCIINWIAELDRRHQPLASRESWNRRGQMADFLDRFADWQFDWLDVPALISSAETVYEFPMVDRDPLPRWSFGCVTLLGDAAHPMYPIGSNGASQAILDARALADALVASADVEVALAAYEATRRPPTAAIVHSNRQHGPERVMDLAEARAPGGFTSVDDVFDAGELEAIASGYKQVAGFSRPGGVISPPAAVGPTDPELRPSGPPDPMLRPSGPPVRTES